MTTVEWTKGNSAGAHTAPVTKLVLHTTEGTSIEGACASYKVNNSWPHTTCAPDEDRVCRHLGYNVAARSLKNLSGGVQTNTGGCVQVEVVGSASNPGGIDWEWIGREIVGPICREVGIPLQSSVPWIAYPASYGLKAPQRLSGTQWNTYMGVLGHQHVPENSHGDPGAIPIELVLDAAQPPAPAPPPPVPALEDDMEAILYHPGNDTHWYACNLAGGRFAVQIDGDASGKLAGKDGVRAWTNLTAVTVDALISALNA